MHRLYAAAAAVCVGLLATGCGGGERESASGELLLQALAAPGPDPFTASTARSGAAFTPPPVTPAPKSPSGNGTTLRTISGSTPGLYAGIQETPGCDVEAQIRLLGKDKARARAFADGAGVEAGDIASFLRGLTPVQVRADTRVTGHGFDGGRAAAHQGVLQAGTAVLVDQYGSPRVRCAAGSPLRQPIAVTTAVVPKGKPWSGYRADRVIVVKPATQVVNNLLIVNLADGSWIERPTGTDGEEDARPEVLPPVDAAEVFSDLSRTGAAGTDAAGTPSPSEAPAPAEPQPVPDAPAPAPAEPQDQPVPAPDEAPLDEEPLPLPAEPGSSLPDAGTGPDAAPAPDVHQG
ncbi:DUF6777 domain-containing protein [Streptomyces zhihengii]|uniref:DUF6777 domain-containing protein n=1 Tax=Streptomyces zhihengii TaxID=1818004 RepID=UPI003624C99B